ncbi:wax ester/triacylglycerol synthase family O-acyltransferase [Nocardia nepalensis]|uniref:wax ester/triacylglycerol synthase family O-acyltransferase n=1 Tax=Nocardia nepalensis TaxID=3375448 RepID=UPI003B67E156
MERQRSNAPVKSLHLFDAGWLWLESDTNLMHASVLAVCREPEGCEEGYVSRLVAGLRSHQDPAPPYDLRLKSTGRGRIWPHWESVDRIDTRYHVRHTQVPDGTGLLDVVSRLQGIQLDRSTPLWTVHIIDGFQDGHFAVLGKLHHSIADGMTGAELLQRWFSTDPSETAKPPVWAKQLPGSRYAPVGNRTQGAAEWSRSWLSRAARRVVSSSRTLRVVPSVVRATRISAADPATRTRTSPRTVLNSVITAERRVAIRSFDLEEFRAISRAAGGTVNDVLLAACSGALRRYLSESDALPKASLVTNIPISIRYTARYGGVGNAITWARIALGTDRADPGQRLASIVRATAKAKGQLSLLRGAALTGYTLLVTLPILVEHLLRLGGRTRPLFNVPVSNVPGPAEPLYLNGSQVMSLHAMTVLYNGQGLNVVCLSYGGRLELSFTACPAAVPDVDRLAALYDESVAELRRCHLPHREG